MSVMVIIKRVFRMDQTKELVALLKKLREESEKQPGFISRTTYSKLSDPGECIVINEWETADDWINWMNQEKARELQWKIDSLIGEKTSFEIYKPEDF
ncbi:MAG: antibiotic biosynthesis monooxygenase family protein [Desulfopila sp.]|nr:antibiotic biosynthesis monooxygenase family protein [Desulfopila sp.]